MAHRSRLDCAWSMLREPSDAFLTQHLGLHAIEMSFQRAVLGYVTLDDFPEFKVTVM